MCEGDDGQVCAVLENIPDDGVACDVTITFNFTENTACKFVIIDPIIIHMSRQCFNCWTLTPGGTLHTAYPFMDNIFVVPLCSLSGF